MIYPPCHQCGKECIPDKEGRLITKYIYRLTTLDSYFCSENCYFKWAKEQDLHNPKIIKVSK